MYPFILLLVPVNKRTPWPGCQLLTNRRCPESLADVMASNNTLSGTPIVAALTHAYRTDIDCA